MAKGQHLAFAFNDCIGNPLVNQHFLLAPGNIVKPVLILQNTAPTLPLQWRTANVS